MATGKLGWWLAVVSLAVATASMGCGDDNSNDRGDAGSEGDGSEGDRDRSGPRTSDDDDDNTWTGDGDTETSDGDTSGGETPPANPAFNWQDLFGPPASDPNTNGMGMMQAATCDPDAPTRATCGGRTCPESTNGLAGLVCLVPCCTADDTCGTRRATLDNPTECAAMAAPDPSCPDYESGFSNLDGCCAANGRCGVISGIDGTCITSSPLLSDLKPGPACGEDMMEHMMDASTPDPGDDPIDAGDDPIDAGDDPIDATDEPADAGTPDAAMDDDDDAG